MDLAQRIFHALPPTVMQTHRASQYLILESAPDEAGSYQVVSAWPIPAWDVEDLSIRVPEEHDPVSALTTVLAERDSYVQGIVVPHALSIPRTTQGPTIHSWTLTGDLYVPR